MNVTHIDHVNIRIPDDRVEDAVAFYRDLLGFTPEKLDLYRDGERTSFAFRLGSTSMLHIRPVTDFEPPEQRNYDHFCLVIDTDIDTLKERLAAHEVAITREGNPWGATGRAPAAYIEDPFGYVIELKTR